MQIYIFEFDFFANHSPTFIDNIALNAMEHTILTTIHYENSLAFAMQQDALDPLAKYREQFYFPKMHGREVIYFTGNSLGLQPKNVQDYVLNELEDWATFGAEGRYHARNPWHQYHEQFSDSLSKLVGGKPVEVTVMNALSVNLHLLMVSFYRPDKKRYKILCESNAFSSDRYIIESQLRFHGFDPQDAIIEIAPRKGDHCIHHKDVLNAIEAHSDSLALVLIGAVNYYNGQVFNIKEITEATHQAGAIAGFDIAHAIGNIHLHLHDWNVDFASWCTYKYLNSGPGGISGIFVHERHLQDALIPRFAGWWGTQKETRFNTNKGFVPSPTAEGWQLGTAPILLLAVHKAALELFDEVGMDALVDKAEKLTGYLEFILDDVNKISGTPFELVTPRDKKQRGCQLSVIPRKGKDFFTLLKQNGVLVTWQEPQVMRCAPVPFYNSFEDVFRFGEIIKNLSAS